VQGLFLSIQPIKNATNNDIDTKLAKNAMIFIGSPPLRLG
jgi:hypothetical protein